MKKLLFILAIFFSLSAQAQQDTIVVDNQQIDSFFSATKYYKFSFPTKSDLKIIEGRVTRLEALAPGLPTPTIVNQSAYTLSADDNGKVVIIQSACTVTCPTLSAGFHCKIIREGTGVVSFVGNIGSYLGYRRISGQYGDVDIDYKTASSIIITGKLTK